MPIPVPREMVFYAEDYGGDGEDREIMLCWIPVEVLKEMTAKAENPVSKQILEDYPDGLDLEVSQREFDRFREGYGLDLGAPADKFLVALTALRASKQATMPEDIRFETVKSYFVDLIDAEMTKERPAVRSIDEAQALLSRESSLQQAVDEQLERLGDSVAFDMSDSRPWEERILGSPAMTAGEPFLNVFSKLHKRSGGRK